MFIITNNWFGTRAILCNNGSFRNAANVTIFSTTPDSPRKYKTKAGALRAAAARWNNDRNRNFETGALDHPVTVEAIADGLTL